MQERPRRDELLVDDAGNCNPVARCNKDVAFGQVGVAQHRVGVNMQHGLGGYGGMRRMAAVIVSSCSAGEPK